jgi:Na+/melibiose symporter-like transporter
MTSTSPILDTIGSTERGQAVYRCGTLVYTKAGLISLFLWLLWGDFVFFLMEAVAPSIVPLRLEKLGASNATIGLMLTTIPYAMNMVMTPIVSFSSDRYRSRWGRRIPFLIWPTPFIVVFLLLLGFSTDLGPWLHQAMHLSAAPATVTVILIGVLMVCFQFFNMFVASVYWYLFNDVVPAQFLGRFMALFRSVGLAASGVYAFAAAPYAESHMRAIFLIAGLTYLVVFTLMCLRIREGTYPPAPENIDGRCNLVSSLRTYAQECFSYRLYWLLYATNTCWAVSVVISTFQVFFFRSVGADTEKYFRLMGVGQWLTIPFMMIGGYFVDRRHPLRVQMVALAGLLLITPVQLVFLFRDFTPAGAYVLLVTSYLVSIPLQGLYAAAEIPMFMRLLPKSRYGQFSSSNALVRAVFALIAGFLAGAFIDGMARLTGDHERAYRFVPLWSLAFQSLAAVFLVMLYFAWRKHGGDAAYVPPGFSADDMLHSDVVETDERD